MDGEDKGLDVLFKPGQPPIEAIYRLSPGTYYLGESKLTQPHNSHKRDSYLRAHTRGK